MASRRRRYTLVIAERNEPDLQPTVENARATQSADLEVLVVSDTSGRGPQACRHAGITAVKTPTVIIADGHMRFAPGALDSLAQLVRLNPQTVFCAKCHHNAELSFADGAYGGARWSWKSEERNQYWVLSGKWRDTAEPGEIGVPMGACYAFSREWYEHIGAPWRLGQGWGMDEETLAACTQLMGGRVELAPVEVAHRARAQADLPYALTHRQAAGVWANRLAIVEMLPMAADDRHELTTWLNRNAIMAVAQTICPIAEAHKLRELLAGGPLSWSDWKSRYINPTAEAPPGEAEMRKRLEKTGRIVPAGATVADMVREYVKPAATLERPPPQRIPNRIVQDTGVRCVHCGHRFDHRVTHTYPNDRRRVLCGGCRRPFITARTMAAVQSS
jgi:hypothetical protein